MEKFEQLVTRAVQSLPDEFLERLENVNVLVEAHPTPEQLTKASISHKYTLLGLYEGIPLTERHQGYSLQPPDNITIFKEPIEHKCGNNEAKIIAEIQNVVQHEIGHYFGIGEARLRQIEKAKLERKGKAHRP